MPHHRKVAVALLPLLLEVAAGCAAEAPTPFAGRAQTKAFQTALRTCLARAGIDYEPVIEPPGSVMPLVPAPAPYEWWARHGGYGLIDDQSAEIELDVTWVDPNQERFEQGAERWRTRLYGSGGSPERFRRGACYDAALRDAGFFDESRLGTLPAPTPPQIRAAATSPEVIAARERRSRCLIEAGIDAPFADDPEGTLRRRFVDDGLIESDGVRRAQADGKVADAALRLEERVAVADVRCRRSAGLDRSADAVIRQLLGRGN